MKRVSWKYLAGLVDGEGCIDLQRVKDPRSGEYTYVRPRLRLSMVSVAHDLMEMLKVNFGGSLQVNSRDNPNWQSVVTWAMCGKAARPVLQNIRNHLIVKREQANLAIYMIDNVMGKQIPVSVKERLSEEMKAMKRDPQRLSETAVRDAMSLMG